MNEEEKDFFQRCFGIVAGLEVENETQAIAKEVVLDEIENLQSQLEQKEKQLNEIKEYVEELYDNTDDITCYDIDKNIKEELLSIIERNNSNE